MPQLSFIYNHDASLIGGGTVVRRMDHWHWHSIVVGATGTASVLQVRVRGAAWAGHGGSAPAASASGSGTTAVTSVLAQPSRITQASHHDGQWREFEPVSNRELITTDSRSFTTGRA